MYGTHFHVGSTILSGALTYPLYRLTKWLYFQAAGVEIPVNLRFFLVLGVFFAAYFVARILLYLISRKWF